MVNGYIPDRIYEDIDTVKSPSKKNCDGGKQCTCSPKDKLKKKMTPMNGLYLSVVLFTIYYFVFKNKKRKYRK